MSRPDKRTARPPGGLRGPLSSSLPGLTPLRREPTPQPPRPAGHEHLLWLLPLAYAGASTWGEELSTSISRAEKRRATSHFLIHASPKLLLTAVRSLDELPNLVRRFLSVPPLLMLGNSWFGSTGQEILKKLRTCSVF